MIEEILFALLGLLLAFNVGHLLTLRRCESALLALTLESKALTSFDPSAIMSNLKDEVNDMVADIVGSMRQPTIADHLGGVMAQFAQMKMMRSLQESGIMDAVPDALSIEHGMDVD